MWDVMATRWAGEKDWMSKRKEHTSPSDKYMFITYILNEMVLPTEHRKMENKDGDKKFKKNTPRDLGPEGNTLFTRVKTNLQCNCVDGDSNVACTWINGEFAQGAKYKDTIRKIQRILHSWWKKGAATPTSNIDNFVKHTDREHDQEADIGAHARRKNDIKRKDAQTTWTAIRGFKDDGTSGCAIVIKGG